MKRTIEYRISGDNITPETFSLKELASILESTEEMLMAEVGHGEKTIKESLKISLVEVKQGSLCMGLWSSQPDPVIDALSRIGMAINTGSYDSLQTVAVERIKALSRVAKQKLCTLAFNLVGEKVVDLAVITHTTDVSMKYIITGDTDVYGVVCRVGGKEPHALIQPYGSEYTIACKVDEEKARLLGARLYTEVGLSGEATWQIKTGRIIEFRVAKILDYEPAAPDEAFAELRKKYGKYFDDIVDPVAFTRATRGGD